VLKGLARALAACGVLGLTGCFVYVPAEVQTVPAGQSVRLRVSRAAVAELEDVIPGAEPVVRGTLVRRDQDRLFVRVPIARRDGFMNQAIVQDVGIAAGDILELELRRRSPTRTALFVAGTGLMAATIVGVILTGGQDKVGEEIPPPDEIRIPFGR
jgi:hypothetical protein